MSVTGLVLPATLETAAEVVFEDLVVVSGRASAPGSSVMSGSCGTAAVRRTSGSWGRGASVAFRRGAFDRVGGFDPRLGAGAAGCSEDSEMWYRLLSGGWCARYEPGAVVHHSHRKDLPRLREQSRAYLRGHVAALAVQWNHTRQIGEPRRALISLPMYYMRRAVLGVSLGGIVPDPRRGDSRLHSGALAGGTMARPVLLPLPPAALPGEGPSVKVPLARFLATNPFPHRRTLGSWYGEKMRAIHEISP
jgi:hypothetical protein